MATIKKLDKKSGTIYVYDSTSYWDKDKKQSRSNRKLIGKIDPITGEVVPTRGRRLSRKNDEKSLASIPQKPSSPTDADGDSMEGLRGQYRQTIAERDRVIAELRKKVESLSREKLDLLSRLNNLIKEFTP